MSCFLFTTRHRQRKEGISLEGAELKLSDRSQEQTGKAPDAEALHLLQAIAILKWCYRALRGSKVVIFQTGPLGFRGLKRRKPSFVVFKVQGLRRLKRRPVTAQGG